MLVEDAIPSAWEGWSKKKKNSLEWMSKRVKHLEREKKMDVGMMKFISQKDWLKLLYKEVRRSVFNEKLSIRIFNANQVFRK